MKKLLLYKGRCCCWERYRMSMGPGANYENKWAAGAILL
jgi:hypothetical protein